MSQAPDHLVTWQPSHLVKWHLVTWHLVTWHLVTWHLAPGQGGLLGSGIKWNFTKFVVDQAGQPVARLGPMTDPIPAVQEEVDKLLK